MNINYLDALLSIFLGAVGVALAFYIKEFLQKRQQYRRLKEKLEKVAGKNARVIYGEDETFRISEIDEDGITLTNELKTIFIPTAMLLQTETILPSDKYDDILDQRKKEEEEHKNRLMVEALQKTMPSFTSGLLEEYQKDSQQTRELFRQLIEKASSTDSKSIGVLVETLINTRALQPPDPAQALGMKLAKVITDAGILDGLTASLPKPPKE